MGKIEPPVSSPSLLVAVQRRDPEAWRRLIAIYGPLVYDWGQRKGLQGADAADVMQQVFTSVSQGIDQAQWNRPGDSFRGWLWTVFHSRLMDFYRDRRRQPVALSDSEAVQIPIEPATTEVRPADESDNMLLVRRTLDTIRGDFSEATWEAFWRSSVDGHATSEIAHDLGLSSAAVCMCRSRVLRRLRETLEELGIRVSGDQQFSR
jgi:RNA polymerase sigma-70 factor (ECF subfamily)